MTKIGYQLFDLEGDFAGYYIWTNKEHALEICSIMNKDREECGLTPSLDIKAVEIIF